MKALFPILAWLSRGIDDAARGLSRLRGALRPRRRLCLTEQAGGEFLVHIPGRSAKPVSSRWRIDDGRIVEPDAAQFRSRLAGADVEIILDPSRFLFRPLELPSRAGDFLEGVVRAQIDRLTPWTVGEAAFGWAAPAASNADRMVVTIAATARSTLEPIIAAFAPFRVHSLVLSTGSEVPDQDRGPIPVLSQRNGAARGAARTRRLLLAGLGLAAIAAIGSLGAAVVIGENLDDQLTDLQRRILEHRMALLNGRQSVDDEAVANLSALKRATPAGVLVLESLSRTLPDDTYLTELRIADGKVQIAGLTRDAPALIGLIEQSRQFTRATFFAPTTREATDSADRFHIEAAIEPKLTVFQ